MSAAPTPRTGVPPVDAELGALPERGRWAIFHDRRVDPGPLLHQVLHGWIADGGRAVFGTALRPRTPVRDDHVRLGFDATRLDAAVQVVDLGASGTAREAAAALARALRAAPGAAVFLEAAGSLREQLGPDAAPELGAALREGAPDRWVFLPLAQRPSEADARADLGPFDVELRLGPRTFSGVRYEALQVARTPERPGGAPRTYLYRVDRPGGVRAHVPKILITGPHHAGKSTFVHHAASGSVSVGSGGTTVSLDHGRVDRAGLAIELFGTPGQERFEPIIRAAAHGAVGVLVLVDSTRPETIRRSREMAEEVGAAALPTVYAATKRDAPDAMTLEEIRRRLDVPESVPLIPMVATDPQEVGRVLDVLVERILTWRSSPTAGEPG